MDAMHAMKAGHSLGANFAAVHEKSELGGRLGALIACATYTCSIDHAV
jgi:hypothetical protein